MAVLALLRGARPHFSLGGSLEVVLVGLGYGVVGGLVLAALGDRFNARRAVRGTVLGLLTLGLAWLTSRVGQPAATGLDAGDLGLALAGAAVLFVAYGLALVSVIGANGAHASP